MGIGEITKLNKNTYNKGITKWAIARSTLTFCSSINRRENKYRRGPLKTIKTIDLKRQNKTISTISTTKKSDAYRNRLLESGASSDIFRLTLIIF